MSDLGITGVNAVILSLFVAGFVDMIKYAFNKEWLKMATIITAAISGLVGGMMIGIHPIMGMCAGFAASGAISVVKRVGDY